MPFLEIKKPGESTDIIVVNIASISSLELSTSGYSNSVVLELAGGKTKYTWSYETQQDAENAFATLKDELGDDIATVVV
jgi:hypothetical protein